MKSNSTSPNSSWSIVWNECKGYHQPPHEQLPIVGRIDELDERVYARRETGAQNTRCSLDQISTYSIRIEFSGTYQHFTHII